MGAYQTAITVGQLSSAGQRKIYEMNLTARSMSR